MRTGKPTSALVRWHGPWGQRFPAVPDAARFHVVLSGTCHLLPEDGGPAVALHAGDVLFMPRGHGYTLAADPSATVAEPHCAPSDGDPHLLVTDADGEPDGAGPVTVTLCGGYRLDTDNAHPLLRELPDVVRLSGSVPGVAEAVTLLAREARSRPGPRGPHDNGPDNGPGHGLGLGTDTLVPALLDVLLLYILRSQYEGSARRRGGWSRALSDSDPGIGAALTAMHREPQRPWTVATLASRAGMSRAAFARRFHELVGRPPLGYLTWWRMTTAARLLRTTDSSLAQLAAGSGYASEYAFAHAFKRAHGIPPGRYRGIRRDQRD